MRMCSVQDAPTHAELEERRAQLLSEQPVRFTLRIGETLTASTYVDIVVKELMCEADVWRFVGFCLGGSRLQEAFGTIVPRAADGSILGSGSMHFRGDSRPRFPAVTSG